MTGARGIGDLRGWWFVGAVLAGFGVGSLVYTLRVRPVLPLAMPWWGAAVFLVVVVGVASVDQPTSFRLGWLLGVASVLGAFLPRGTNAGFCASPLCTLGNPGTCFLWGSRHTVGKEARLGAFFLLLVAASLRLLALGSGGSL